MNTVSAVVVSLIGIAVAAPGEPAIERTDSAVEVALGNGVELEFALHDGFLLGLRKAAVDGVPLKDDATVVRPYLIREWGPSPLYLDTLKFRDAAVRDGKVVLAADLMDAAGAHAGRDFFVYAPDYALADASPLLREAREKRAAAEALIRAAVTNHPTYRAGEAVLAAARARLKENKDPALRKAIEGDIGKAKTAIAAAEKELPDRLAAESADVSRARADVAAWRAAREALASSNLVVHADYYLFPIAQLPSLVCAVTNQTRIVAARAATAKPAGVLRWVFEPAGENVAGWPWKGWTHHYEFELADGRQVNSLREVGTWELGGHASGNTLVNLRYRGLGGIVARLHPVGDEVPPPGARIPIGNAFTTTETLPGAVSQAPIVSPAVPGRQDIASSRTEAMKYRHGAWIAQPQRGAGVNWVDFQYGPTAALASFYDRMETIRSVTEIWPGDAQVSHYDGLYFPLTARGVSTPKRFVALVPTGGLPEHEWHTRWQEMDQFARDRIAAELGFVRRDPLPSLGLNWDTGWEGRLKGLIANLDALRDAGVKRVLVHHPGWFNGRGLRQGESAFPIPKDKDGKPDTGGDCSIHDYVPQSDAVRSLWANLTARMKQADMEYWVWITGMVHERGPVVGRFGPARFCRNSPAVDFSSGYPGGGGRSGNRGIAILDPDIRAWWDERMAAAVTDLGVAGFWADSFQNMFMSQMNYQRPDAAPHNRAWWEWIAAASKRGAGWMAESQGFPGLSCSIEVGGSPHDFEGIWWVLPHVTRWYRGEPVPDKGTDRADRLFFRSMANKGPVCPGDGDPAQVPNYRRLSAEYMAALPAMKRPYQLPAEGGVLWLPTGSDTNGVLFSFGDRAAVPGLERQSVLSGEPPVVGPLRAHATYRVKSVDLLKSLGVHSPPQPDPRRAP